MASTTQVWVVDSTAKRVQVKVNPGTFMSDVLEEACKKCGRKRENLGFKHNNKQIDLIQTFRQTGLPSGARLDLVTTSRSPLPVRVALQLPEPLAAGVGGGRLTDKFPSDTTLWRVLRKFESSEGKNLNFTGRGVAQTDNGTSGAGQIFYEMPVVSLAGREISTLPDLAKTLSQYGVTQDILLRLSFRKTDQPFEEARIEIEQYLKSLDNPAESTPSSASTSAQPEIETVTSAVANIPNPSDVSPESSPKAVTPTKRAAPDDENLVANKSGMSFFVAPSSSVPIAATQPHNDSDYELSIAQMKRHQEHLKSSTTNKKLLGYAESDKLEAERIAKLASVNEVTLRIRFPDNTFVERAFDANDTGLTVYDIVSSVIRAGNQPFKLITMDPKGPKTIPKDSSKLLIKHLGLTGRILVNLHWDDNASAEARKHPILKEEFNQQTKDLPVQVFENAQTSEPKPGNDQSKVEDKGKGKQTEFGSKALNNIRNRFSKK